MKVDLLLEPMGGFHNYDLGPRPVPVKRSLPWYRTGYRRVGSVAYMHRVRSALLHRHIAGNYVKVTQQYIKGHDWISYRLWCGTQGSSNHGELFGELPERSVVCATCEARAVGAGFPPLVITAHKPIKFRPMPRYQPEWSTR